MRAIALCACLLLARLLVVLGHPVPASPWSLLAFIWQDLVVVLLFAATDRLIPRPRATWPLYILLVLYAAINVPLQRIFLTPLTWPMARAARGPLADSIRVYLTWANCTMMSAVAAVGLATPLLLSKWRRAKGLATRTSVCRLGDRSRAALCMAGAAALLLLGPRATSRVDTSGLNQNAVMALVRSGLPHVRAKQGQASWSASPFGGHTGESLVQWQGACSGRNVILILLESTGAQSLAAFGARVDPTPRLTELSQNAMLVDNAYCVYPESIKGLYSVLCSQYPAFDTQPADYDRLHAPSLAQVLSTNGYATALFHSGRFMYLGMESIVQNRGYELLQDAGDIGGNHQSSFGIDEPATVQSMLDWIESLSGRRFFLTYLPIAGHHPYEAPEGGPFPENDERGRYRNALHMGDAALGSFICGLKERQLLDNTLLILCGDHGEAFGQHEGNFGHTLFIYEENVHVPLLFVAPGLIQGQRRVQRLASLIDVTPTVLDLVGIPSLEQHQGRSLLEPQDQLVLFYADYALPWIGLRDGRWKFLDELGSGRPRLFDLAADPQESVDLSSKFSERAAIYRRHARDWAAAQKANVLSATALSGR